MEKLVAFTVALLSLCQIAVAQPCINGVTTNPNAPKPDSPGQYEKFKKNTYFDWRHQTFKINLENNPFTTLESPYWNTRTGSDVFSHLVVSKDYEPSDGWELIKMGFGYAWDASIAPDPNYVKIEKTTDPNGVEILFKIHRNSTTSYPLSKPSLGYFVLYNKYSGKMKFFGSNYQFTGSGSAIEIEVMLLERLLKTNTSPVEYSASGLFAHYGPHSVALDKPTERKAAYSFGHFPQPADFFMTDFQTAYDPCTCIYPSALEFSVFKVYQGNIYLTGSMIVSGNKKVFDGIGYYGNSPTDSYLLNYMKVNPNPNNYLSGMMNYKQLYKFIDEYEDYAATGFLTAEEKEILSKLPALLEYGGSIASIIPDPSGTAAAIGTGLGILASGIDLFTSNVSSTSTETSTLFGRMALSGTYERRDEQLGFSTTIGNPGSLNTPNYLEHFINGTGEPAYPLYNEVLGVFGMLETPTYSRYKTGLFQVTESNQWNRWDRTIDEITYDLQDQNIKFAVNPILNVDYDKSVIKGRWVIEVDNKTGQWNSQTMEVSGLTKNMYSPDPLRPYFSEYYSEFTNLPNLKTIRPRITQKSKNRVWNNYCPPLECWGLDINQTLEYSHKLYVEIVASLAVKNQDGTYRIVPFIAKYPLEMQGDFNYDFLSQSSTSAPKEYEITGSVSGNFVAYDVLYLSGNVQANSPVILSAKKIIIQNGAIVSGNITLREDFVQHLEIGNNVNLTNLSSSSWSTLKSIVIKSGLIQPQTSFTFSSSTITADPSSSFLPNIVFDATNSAENEKALPQTEAEIRTFCEDNPGGGGGELIKYRAKEFAASYPAHPKKDSIRSDTQDSTTTTVNSFTIYPNPTDVLLKSDIIISKAGHVGLNIYDMAGLKLISTKPQHLDAGSYAFELEVGTLKNGIYIVELVYESERQTRKLIISH